MTEVVRRFIISYRGIALARSRIQQLGLPAYFCISDKLREKVVACLKQLLYQTDDVDSFWLKRLTVTIPAEEWARIDAAIEAFQKPASELYYIPSTEIKAAQDLLSRLVANYEAGGLCLCKFSRSYRIWAPFAAGHLAEELLDHGQIIIPLSEGQTVYNRD
jgi:hypothetical protein